MSRPDWPVNVVDGRMPGTKAYSALLMCHHFGGTLDRPVFPPGWRPVAYYADARSWDLAPRWTAPALRAWRLVRFDARMMLARLLYAMAYKVAGKR